MMKTGFWNSTLIVVLTHALFWTPMLAFAQPFRVPPRMPANEAGAAATPNNPLFARNQMLGITPTGRADLYWGFAEDPVAGRERSASEMQRRIGHLQSPKPLLSGTFSVNVGGTLHSSISANSIAAMQAVIDEYMRAMRWIQLVAPNERILTRSTQMLQTTNQAQLSRAAFLRQQITAYGELIRSIADKPAGNGQTIGAQADKMFREAQSTLTTQASKTEWDRNSGYRRQVSRFNVMTGAIQVTQNTLNSPSVRNMGRIAGQAPSQIISALQAGRAVPITGTSLGIMAIMFSFSYGKLIGTPWVKGYQENPNAVEDAYDQYINVMTFTQMALFFALGYHGDKLNFMRLLKSHRHSNAIAKHAGASAEFRKSQKAFLGGMSLYGLGLGAIASFAWGMNGQYLKACTNLFNNGRPIDERPGLSPAEKIQYAQMCDEGFTAFIQNNWGQFARQTAALFPTIFIMAYAQNKLMSGMNPNNTTFRDEWNRYKRGLPDGKPTFRGLWGLARGGGRILLIMGTTFVGGMIAFTVLHFAIEQLIEWLYYRWSVVRPLTRSREDFEEALEELRNNNWRLMEYDDLPATDLEANQQQATEHTEAHKAMLEKMAAYSKASEGIRNHEIQKVTNALTNWSNQYAKAVNIYAAAKLFYTDIAEQIQIRRDQDRPLTILAPDNDTDPYTFENLLLHANEPLPLFRSSPFHGLDSTLNFTFRTQVATEDDEEGATEAVDAIGAIRPVPHWPYVKQLSDMSFNPALLPDAAFPMQLITENRYLSFLNLRSRLISIFDEIEPQLDRSWSRRLKMYFDEMRIEEGTTPLPASINAEISPEAKKLIAKQVKYMWGLSYHLTDNWRLDDYCRTQRLDREGNLVVRGRDDSQQQAGDPENYDYWPEPAQAIPFCKLYLTFTQSLDSQLFHGLEVPYQGGFRYTSGDDEKLGFKPGVMGAEFVDNYRLRFKDMQIDADWYHEEAYRNWWLGGGYEMLSLPYELLVSMFCGPDAESSYGDSSPGWKKDFLAPRLPMKSGRDFCPAIKTALADGGKDLLLSLDVEDENGRKYQGVIDLLYHELDDSKVGRDNMEMWFDTRVAEGLQADLAQANDDFREDVIYGYFAKVMTTQNQTREFGFGGREFYGGVRSLFEEFSFYFENIINPMMYNHEFEKLNSEDYTISLFDTGGNLLVSREVNWFTDFYQFELEQPFVQQDGDQTGPLRNQYDDRIEHAGNENPRLMFDLLKNTLLRREQAFHELDVIKPIEFQKLAYQIRLDVLVLRSLLGSKNGTMRFSDAGSLPYTNILQMITEHPDLEATTGDAMGEMIKAVVTQGADPSTQMAVRQDIELPEVVVSIMNMMFLVFQDQERLRTSEDEEDHQKAELLNQVVGDCIAYLGLYAKLGLHQVKLDKVDILSSTSNEFQGIHTGQDLAELSLQTIQVKYKALLDVYQNMTALEELLEKVE